MDKNKSRLQQLWPLLFLLAWAFLLHYPFIYKHGAGEGDSFALVNGIIDAINQGDFLDNPLLVFNFYSFGYYWLVFKLQPFFAPDPASVFALVNHLGFVCSLLTTIPLYLFLKDLCGQKVAFYSLLIYPLIPTVFEVSTYGHPVTAAWLFMSMALYFTQRAIMQDKQPVSDYLLGAGVILTTLAMCFRTDVIFLAPIFWGLLYYHNRLHKEWMSRMGLFVLLSFVLFSILQLAGTGMGWHQLTPGIFFRDLNKFYVTGGDFLLRLARGVVALALGLGPLAALLVLAGFFYLYRTERKLFVFLASWVLPIVVFWLPFATPTRHFLYAMLGLLVPVVYLLQAAGKRFFPLGVAVFLVLNYYSPLPFYQTIVDFRPDPGLAKGQKQVSFAAPLLPVLENHYYLQKELDSYWQEAQAIAKIKDESVILIDYFILSALNAVITSRPGYDWQGRMSLSRGYKFIGHTIGTPSNKYFLLRAPADSQPQRALERVNQRLNLSDHKLLIFPRTFAKFPELKVPEWLDTRVVSGTEPAD